MHGSTPLTTRRICTQCGSDFEITKEDMAFYDKVSPVFGWKKYQIPPPSICPMHRKQRRLAFQNMYSLYMRVCDGTGDVMISRYSSDVPFPVYHNSYWWSDKWNPLDFDCDFDFNKPFFSQFKKLRDVVPRTNIATNFETIENSEYVNYASYLKNCYLVFHTLMCEDCYYGVGLKHSENLVDCRHVYNSKICYSCVDCNNCYKLFFGLNCQNCSDSLFMRDCTGCRWCFGCCNLRQKQYCIFNEQKTKGEYEDFIKNFPLYSFNAIEKMKNKFKSFSENQIFKAMHGEQNEDVSGDWIYQSQNVHNSFHIIDARDCKFCERIYSKCESCYDVDQFGERAEKLYESETCGVDIYNLLFCMYVRNGSHDVMYSDLCYNSDHCFGCVGLRNASYCILNKQYTKEEYEELVPKIIEHMKKTGEYGEFFPVELSTFAYNETVAQEYFPLTKEEVETKGWKWRDEKDKTPQVEKIIKADQLPDSIDDIPNDILDWVIQCHLTNKPFKIIKQELEFYREHHLPIPRVHPDKRRKILFSIENSSNLYFRQCDKCEKEIQTTYAPDRPETVYCERCYLETVY